MKNTAHYLYVWLTGMTALCLTACSSDTADFLSDALGMTEQLVIETDADITRTTLAEDGSTVKWTPGDRIAIYDHKSDKRVFTASISNNRTRFAGTVTAKTVNYLALYPFQLADDALAGENSIGATVPASQTLAEGTFLDGVNISVAKGERNIDGSPSRITFYNVCQLIRFSIPEYADKQITKVTFTADVAVAGKLTIDMTAETPQTTTASDGSKTITLLPPVGSTTFNAGNYYIVTAPVRIGAFTMQFNTSGTAYSLSGNTPFGGTSGKVYDMSSIDLVKQPEISSSLVYENEELKGTALTLTAPLENSTWSATIRNSSNTVVRTIAPAMGTLTSDASDAEWPYLPKGTYTAEYTYTTTNGKSITASRSFSINTTPVIGATLSALTSYSYYAGQGVTQSIEQANACDAFTVYNPKASVTKVAKEILENSNYSTLFGTSASSFGATVQTAANGVFTYNNFASNGTGTKNISATLTFDGGSATASADIVITGLPYAAKTPTNGDWTGSPANWSATMSGLTGVRMANGDSPITKTFYVPTDNQIHVNTYCRAVMRRGSVDGTAIIFSVKAGGETIISESADRGATKNIDQTAAGTIADTNPTITCSSSRNYLESTYAVVGSIGVSYR